MTELSSLNIVKNNSLTRACYKLGLDEQRLVLACVAQIDSRRPTSKKLIRVYAKDYAELYGLQLNNAYKQLKIAARNLFDRKIHQVDGKRQRDTRWIYDAIYDDGGGFVDVGFSPSIEPYLTLLGTKFTKYKLKQIAGLKSPYSIRLLEVFMSFKDGWWEVEVDELRQMLMIEDQYTKFSNLKARVLEVARKELLAHSGIEVTYIVKKRIRRQPHILRFEWRVLEGDAHLQQELFITA